MQIKEYIFFDVTIFVYYFLSSFPVCVRGTTGGALGNRSGLVQKDVSPFTWPHYTQRSFGSLNL